MTALPRPAFDAMSETKFLTGSSKDEPVIDDIFGKAWHVILKAAQTDEPPMLEPAGEPVPADAAPSYALQAVEGGIVLVDLSAGAGAEAWVGGYVGVDLAIAREHRGRGLGAELVLARFLRDGELPTWWLDEAAYSRAGAAAHRAALRLGRSRPDLVERLEAAWAEVAEEAEAPRP